MLKKIQSHFSKCGDVCLSRDFGIFSLQNNVDEYYIRKSFLININM